MPNSIMTTCGEIRGTSCQWEGVVAYKGILFLLEFKDGDTEYRNSTFKQVMDYALDLKNFHKGSRDKFIVPIAVCKFWSFY